MESFDEIFKYFWELKNKIEWKEREIWGKSTKKIFYFIFDIKYNKLLEKFE